MKRYLKKVTGKIRRDPGKNPGILPVCKSGNHVIMSNFVVTLSTDHNPFVLNEFKVKIGKTPMHPRCHDLLFVSDTYLL